MKRLVLTFDDGVRSHYDLVRPLLKERGLTGTFFIPAGRTLWLHQNKDPRMREGGLSWSELLEMHEDGFEMANHTRDHVPLTGLDHDGIVAQITGLDAEFEANHLPRPVSLGFPGYWCNDNVVACVKSTHIQFARTGYIDGDLLPNHHDKRPAVRHYAPGMTDPHRIYSTGILNDSYTTETFISDLEATPEGCVAIFTAHGFQLPHRWKLFTEMVEYVVNRRYQTMTMRELPTQCGELQSEYQR